MVAFEGIGTGLLLVGGGEEVPVPLPLPLPEPVPVPLAVPVPPDVVVFPVPIAGSAGLPPLRTGVFNAPPHPVPLRSMQALAAKRIKVLFTDSRDHEFASSRGAPRLSGAVGMGTIGLST
jgi:hypothetical protein